MGLSEIKVVEKSGYKEVYIDGVKQNNVAMVETQVLPGEITVVRVSYYTNKFEVIRKGQEQ